MEQQALADVRGAARLRRAGAGAARGRSPVRRAAARRLPPRGRHRRAPDDGARHGGAPRRPRSPCATPASATTSARARRRPRYCRATCGHEERSVALVREMSERLRVDNACRALADVVAREHGNVHRSGEFGAAALLRLLERCDALRRPERFAEAAARLRMRRARPARPGGAQLSAARAAGRGLAPGAGRRRERGGRGRPGPRRERPGDRRGDPRRADRGAEGTCACEPSPRPSAASGRARTLDEVADRHADQPDQHAAANGRNHSRPDEAEAEVARQAAEADASRARAERR